MKLEVGMYVRTNNGEIGRIEELNHQEGALHSVELNNGSFLLNDNYFKKASHNIIDLIEVGDFITLGEKNYPLQVRNIWEFAGDINIELSNGAKFEDLHNDKNFKIYSIVTKEQFESMEYEVK